MELDPAIQGRRLEVRIKGPITADAMEAFAVVLGLPGIRNVDQVHLVFDDTFSINRRGIQSLVAFLQSLKGLGASILLGGLSCNYRGIFRLLGIHRTADFDMDGQSDQ
jgi:hypothetical protein